MPLLLRRFLKPEPVEISVSHAGLSYSIALRRRATSRRLTLRVSSATGNVVLTVPPHVRLPTAQAFADAHGGWIAARLARLPDRVAIGLGSSVPLRGIPHAVVHGPAARGVARSGSDDDGAPVIVVGGGDATAAGRVRRFLMREAETDLRASVQRHTANLGRPARRITIRDTTSRWGSCSSTGTLSFSWRLILAPPFVLDYLAAHEVGHLRELNHSDRFWAVVHELCPRTDEAEAWLKRNGRELHRYG